MQLNIDLSLTIALETPLLFPPSTPTELPPPDELRPPCMERHCRIYKKERTQIVFTHCLVQIIPFKTSTIPYTFKGRDRTTIWPKWPWHVNKTSKSYFSNYKAFTSSPLTKKNPFQFQNSNFPPLTLSKFSLSFSNPFLQHQNTPLLSHSLSEKVSKQ